MFPGQDSGIPEIIPGGLFDQTVFRLRSIFPAEFRWEQGIIRIIFQSSAPVEGIAGTTVIFRLECEVFLAGFFGVPAEISVFDQQRKRIGFIPAASPVTLFLFIFDQAGCDEIPVVRGISQVGGPDLFEFGRTARIAGLFPGGIQCT